MKKYWESLRPFEKRVLVVGGIFFLVVLHFVMVQPRISEWAVVQDRKWQAERKLRVYQAEIDKRPGYEKQVRVLEDQGGQSVPLEDQASQFRNAIQAQAAQSKVNITQVSHVTTRTNQFFLEQSQGLSVMSGESELVDFLYNLGSGNSLIRVQDLGMRPDPPRQSLVANVKLVASFQKKATTKSTAPGATRPGTATKSQATTVSSRTSTAK